MSRRTKLVSVVGAAVALAGTLAYGNADADSPSPFHYAVELTELGTASKPYEVRLGDDAIVSGQLGRVEADGTLVVRSADGRVRARYNAVVIKVGDAKAGNRASLKVGGNGQLDLYGSSIADLNDGFTVTVK